MSSGFKFHILENPGLLISDPCYNRAVGEVSHRLLALNESEGRLKGLFKTRDPSLALHYCLELAQDDWSGYFPTSHNYTIIVKNGWEFNLFFFAKEVSLFLLLRRNN